MGVISFSSAYMLASQPKSIVSNNSSVNLTSNNTQINKTVQSTKAPGITPTQSYVNSKEI